ncbi:hypothetical protein ES705_37039 [subsurface metagenome]
MDNLQLDIADFGYWTSPKHWQQETLLPCHTFVYSIMNKEGLAISKAHKIILKAYEGPDIDKLTGINALKARRKPLKPDQRSEFEEE